jgi:TonB family protein
MKSASMKTASMKTASIFEELEGRTVGGSCPLLERLGGSTDVGVFLTVRSGIQKAVIKIIRADSTDAAASLAQWETAKSFTHPHLLQIYDFGRTTVEETDVIYVVTEFGDEVLWNVIQERPLDADETREVLIPVLETLSYLHAHGIVHGHVKPTNIFRVANEVKISTDDFLVALGMPKRIARPGHYDAPEVVKGDLTPSADTWSVGVLLCEMMTQRLPNWNWSTNSEPTPPPTMPQPFSDIVLDCLRTSPNQRCRLSEIKTFLESIPAPEKLAKPTIAATTEDPGLSIVELPSDEPEPAAAPSPAAHWSTTQKSAAPPKPNHVGKTKWDQQQEEAPLPQLFSQYEEEREPRRFRFFPVLLGFLVLAAFSMVLLVRSGKLDLPWVAQLISSVTRSTQPATQSAPQNQTQQNPSPQAQPQTQSPTQPDQVPPDQPQVTPGADQSTAAAPQSAIPTESQPQQTAATQPAPAAGEDDQVQSPETPAQPAVEATKQPTPKQAKSHSAPAPEPEQPKVPPEPANTQGSVAKQVMPAVSSAATSSMRSPVQVIVRVNVDRNGAVSRASYVSPGEGNYFARVARRAAEQWQFKAPRLDGHAIPSVWTIEFRFTRSKADVTATRED